MIIINFFSVLSLTLCLPFCIWIGVRLVRFINKFRSGDKKCWYPLGWFILFVVGVIVKFIT